MAPYHGLDLMKPFLRPLRAQWHDCEKACAALEKKRAGTNLEAQT